MDEDETEVKTDSKQGSKPKPRKSHALRDMRLVGVERDLAAIIGNGSSRVGYASQVRIFDTLFDAIKTSGHVEELHDAIVAAGIPYEYRANRPNDGGK